MFDVSKFPALKTKTIIGIGEMAHGSSGLHALAATLIKSAVTELGTRMVGIEAPMGVVELLNERISPTSTHPITKADLKDLYGIFRTTPLLELVRWMYDFNHQPGFDPRRRLDFVGYDIRLPEREFAELGRGTASAGVSFADLTIARLREIEMLPYLGRPDEARAALGDIRARLERVEAALSARPPSQREILLLARLKAWLKVYDVFAATDMNHAYAERDRSMAWLLEQQIAMSKPQAPVVIFAHLNHLLANNHQLRHARPHVIAGTVMGSHLRSRLGEKYGLIGLFAKDIELANAQTDVQRFSAGSGSFESKLASRYGASQFMAVKDLPAEWRDSVRVGQVQPSQSPLLDTMSDWEMRPEEQMEYIGFVQEAKSERPF